MFSYHERDLLSLVFYREFSHQNPPPDFRSFRNSGDYYVALLDWECQRFFYMERRRMWCLTNKEEAKKLLEETEKKS